MGIPNPFVEFKRTVVAIRVGGELFIWSCDDVSRPEVLGPVADMAADPTCPLDWFDAMQIRQQIEAADLLFPPTKE